MAAEDPLELIRDQMAENLARAPNYTCLQTVERARRPNTKSGFRTVDRLRLEVALVAGKEMFAWPGAGHFEDKSPGEMFPGGTTATGEYAMHAQTIFDSDAPEFGDGVEETLDGRRTLRYDFRVSRAMTNYWIQAGEARALVPYRGSFWADAATLDVRRLALEVDEIPARLQVRRATTRIEYAKANIGASEFLLPVRVELVMALADGGESRNRTQFNGCKQYGVETEISFEELVESRRGEDKKETVVQLPAGLTVETRLEDTIDSQTAAIGDLVTARVTFAAKRDGKVVVPKGALLRGRLRRLERGGEQRSFHLVELEFLEVAWEGRRAPWRARLESAGPLVGSRRNSLRVPRDQAAGVAQWVVEGGRVRVPQGFRMLWVAEGLPGGK